MTGFSSDSPTEVMIVQEKSAMELFIERSRFAKWMGIRITEQGEGSAKAVLDIRKEHLNSFGTVHGAVLFALADEAFAVACNSRGQIAMAIQITISYFQSVSEGPLTAVAAEASVNHKLGTYLIDIFDKNNEKIAHFQGMAYRKKETVEDLVRT